MSRSYISEREDSLDAVVRDVLRLKEDEASRLIEALTDLARAIADDEIDRLFNRGDYRG